VENAIWRLSARRENRIKIKSIRRPGGVFFCIHPLIIFPNIPMLGVSVKRALASVSEKIRKRLVSWEIMFSGCWMFCAVISLRCKFL
jgi:hypothetical protein